MLLPSLRLKIKAGKKPVRSRQQASLWFVAWSTIQPRRWTACSSETSVDFQLTARCYIPEDRTFQSSTTIGAATRSTDFTRWTGCITVRLCIWFILCSVLICSFVVGHYAFKLNSILLVSTCGLVLLCGYIFRVVLIT
jgi:hypothetical protein